MKKVFLVFVILLSFLLTGCLEGGTNSDKAQRQAQEQLSSQGNAVAGMPNIVNFREKKLMKVILEMRDKELITYTYTQDMNGRYHKLCDSVGYPLPYSIQYTNPQRVVQPFTTQAVALTINQADPNGLFSEGSPDGTWVMCKDPKSDKVSPVFVEPKLITSTFELN